MAEVQCRTCLAITDMRSSFHLVQKHLLGKTLKDILLLFIPEMVPSLIGEHICISCYKTLRSFAKFIEKSIEVENTLKMIRNVLGDSFDKKNTSAEKSTTKSNSRKLPQQPVLIKGLKNLMPYSRVKVSTYNQKDLKNTTLKEVTNVKDAEELQVPPTSSLGSFKQTSYSNTNLINVCKDKVQEQVKQSSKEQQGMGVTMEKQNLLKQKVCESCSKPFSQDVSMLDATKCEKCLSVEEEKNKGTTAGISEYNGAEPADSNSETCNSVIEITDNEASDFDDEEVCYDEIVGAEGSVNVVRLNSLDTYLIPDYDRVISTSLPTKILPEILNDVSATKVEVFQFGAPSNTENKRVLLFGKKKTSQRCPLCKAGFYDYKALSSHFCDAHVDDPDQDVFDVIKKTAGMSRLNQCPVCQKIVCTRQLLAKHLRLLHRDYVPYKCKRCGKGFRRKSSYDNHITLYKNLDSCDYQRCPDCKKMISKDEFYKHMQHHKYFTCEQCGISFAKAAYLKSHEISHQRKDGNLCFICGKMFTLASNLNYHLKTHDTAEDSVYMCDKCPKTFKTNLRLWCHIKQVHRQKKQFECSECKQKCSTRFALTFHNRLKHAKVFSHVCDICGAQFVRGDYFRRHMASHARTKDPYKPHAWKKYVKNQTAPLQCKYCLKFFKGVYELRTHILGHIKCIRYKCRFCDWSFSCATNRYRHEKRHKDPNFELSCTVCWKRMETKEELDEHLAKHERTKKYKCEECDELFASKYLLRNHVSENHISKEDVEKEKAAVLHEGLEEFLL